jgi:hypothetical protein
MVPAGGRYPNLWDQYDTTDSDSKTQAFSKFKDIKMTFNVPVQHDLKKFRRQLTALEIQVLPQKTVPTLNRVAEKATAKMLWATLVASELALQLIEFVVGSKQPTQQKGGKRGLVKAKVLARHVPTSTPSLLRARAA